MHRSLRFVRQVAPILSAFALLISFSHAVRADADLTAGKALAADCAACHGAFGVSTNALWPHLAGQNEAYLVKQMRDYQSGERIDPVMSGMARPLTDDDIVNVSAYYASLGTSVTEYPEALVLTQEDLSGKIFDGLPYREIYGNQTQLKSVFRTEDGKLAIGAFGWTIESEKTTAIEFEDYPIDEGMFFLEGGMKVVDTQGKVSEAGVGEFLFIPKGWSGTHYVTDMKKISIRYGDKVAREVGK